MHGARGDGFLHHNLDALHEAWVSALSHERGEEASALLEEGQQLDGAGARLGSVDGGLELGEADGSELLDHGLEVSDHLVLDGAYKVGDIAEVRVERAARDVGAVGDGGHRDAREVARRIDLGSKGVSQSRARAD